MGQDILIKNTILPYGTVANQIDQNKDGVITFDELVMKVTSFYKDAGKNNDGLVTEEEYIIYWVSIE